jgi:4-azaleucine resistance transporter AzlC
MSESKVLSPRTEFIAGIKAISPILLGVVPFATISGIAAVEVGLSTPLALALSFIVYAGTAQLAALQLLAANAPPVVIIFTAVIINLRFAMYSASLAPYFKRLPAKWKGILSYIITDQAYAVSIVHFNRDERANHPWFYLGAALAMWGTWQVGAIAGIFLGTRVPESWSLDFAIPLTFTTLLAPAIKDSAAVVAALVAGVVVIVGFHLPFNSSLIVAATAGILGGVAVEWWQGPAQ